ncbi:spermidine synthase-like protein [Candidatus Magnetoovum chiemensis]|nr:spermidine synthase-like protein [Candidatus Magnetoovum chiemensis]
MLDTVFDYNTVVFQDPIGYSNGYIYVNGKKGEGEKDTKKLAVASKDIENIPIPTDDWPYLYLKERTLPNHYILFIVIVSVLGLSSLFLLPSGQRKIKLPYFILGAAFFLIETSNVVALSLLYGSTWIVNVTVFAGILTLVLIGTVTCAIIKTPKYGLYFILLFVCLTASYVIPVSLILEVDNYLLRGLCAVLVYLSPVYFASLIFGTLIKQEQENLYQAYGSNLLGALIGGTFEYLSLITGIKFLLIITAAFYLLTALFVFKTSRGKTAAAI